MRTYGLAILLLTLSSSVYAHVGSPEVYFEGDAGPYRLLVKVSPPAMVPGIAQVQVRVTSGTVGSISVAPVYLNGRDQGLPPAPDSLQLSAADPLWFTGTVWMWNQDHGKCASRSLGLKGPESWRFRFPFLHAALCRWKGRSPRRSSDSCCSFRSALSRSLEQPPAKADSRPRRHLHRATDAWDASQWCLPPYW